MNTKFFIHLIILAFISLNAIAQPSYSWSHTWGGPSNDKCESITVDAAGNIYKTGHFSGTADFDPSSGTYYLTSSGNNDIFITKLNTAGNLIWAKSIGNYANEVGTHIALDPFGNIYVTGAFSSVAVDFDPGVGTFNLLSNGNEDVFLLKLNAAGNFVWAIGMGGGGNDVSKSIGFDNAGNAYLCGWFWGSADFDPGVLNFYLTAVGSYDYFVVKVDGQGALMWAKGFGSANDEIALSSVVDAAGNVYTTGWFQSGIDFDPGPASYFLYGNSGSADIYVQKLDINGNFVWAKQFGGPANETESYLAIDASSNIYLTGYFIGTVDFNPDAALFNLTSNGLADVFITKLNTAGGFVFAKNMGGPLDDVGYRIALDQSGNIYVTGRFEVTADFDPSIGQTNLSSNGGQDVFTAKYNATGAINWAKKLGGPNNDYGLALAVDAFQNVFTGGTFSGTVDFDPDLGITNATSFGADDAFIQKLSPLACLSANAPVLSAAASSICTGQSTTLSVSGGNLNSAQTWKWYTVGCGTTSIGIGTSIIVTPTSTTTYFVRGEGGCISSTGLCSSITITVNPKPNITTTATAYSIPCGSSSTITAAGGVSYIWQPGNISSNSINVSPLTTSAYTVTGTNVNGCTKTAARTITVLGSCNLTLSLTCFIQGFYSVTNTMNAALLNQGVAGASSLITDSVVVELHSSNAPYAQSYSYKGLLQTNGNLTCTFPNTCIGNSYYIVLKHRSSIETWSANPVTMSSNTNYNFTTASSKAYGNNLVEVGANQFALYSGDINQDGAIDVFDYILLDGDVINGNSGYLNTDLNGDGTVDAFDYILLGPTITLGIGILQP